MLNLSKHHVDMLSIAPLPQSWLRLHEWELDFQNNVVINSHLSRSRS